tara:strand:- start:27 stop:557 length:531 start_codon:yes stop_codon:yes gene_type:complete
MQNIVKKDNFVPINIGIVTISDTRTKLDDKSGDLLNNRILNFGHKVVIRKIIKDELDLIKETLNELVSNESIDIVITTGGTGLTGRDSTPEAIESIADKFIQGFGELFRQISYSKIGTSTIQSRAIGCIVNGKYIFALPGSTSACKDAWDEILKFQLDIRHKPCNFIELIPRLKEK